MNLTAIAGLITAVLGGVGGLVGLRYTKNKAKAEAESFVVASSKAVTDMWEAMAGRLQTDVDKLRVDLDKAVQRNQRLEAALRAAGIEVPL